MTFLQKLEAVITRSNSLLCIGLDPDFEKLPTPLQNDKTPYFTFNKAIIDATADLVCAFKPNSAFYEALGAFGIYQLQATCRYINKNYPHIPIILDFKRGDIGNTNSQYAKFAFEYLGVDAITIQPWQGLKAIQPFLDYRNKGIIVLCRTSNPGADELQSLNIKSKKQYLYLAEKVKNEWNTNKNCLLVVGATYPDELAEIRTAVGDKMVFLVPGIGAQGGDIETILRAGLNNSGRGLIINSSRQVLYASSDANFAETARHEALELRDAINQYRKV